MVESNLPKKTESDYECPVCYEVCAEPVMTPCKHFFCLVCQKQVMKNGMCCPLCRAHFDKLFVPQVDTVFQKEIMENAKDAFEARKEKLI